MRRFSCRFALTPSNVSSRHEYATNRFECSGVRRRKGVLRSSRWAVLSGLEFHALLGLERAEVRKLCSLGQSSMKQRFLTRKNCGQSSSPLKEVRSPGLFDKWK